MNVSSIMRRIGRKLMSPFLGDTDSRTALLRKMPKHAVCAEIGVWKGGFSERILKMTEPRELNLIDPGLFSQVSDRMFGARSPRTATIWTESIRTSANAGQPAQRNDTGFSEEVLKQFEDRYFDWVYIDGNHYYDFVRKDLELAYLKVKSGGYITGMTTPGARRRRFPSSGAVRDFVKERHIRMKPEVIGDQFIVVGLDATRAAAWQNQESRQGYAPALRRFLISTRMHRFAPELPKEEIEVLAALGQKSSSSATLRT
jgi:hypothetical protein